MRQTIFMASRWIAIQQQGHAGGRDLLMLIEEIQELWEERAQLQSTITMLQEFSAEDPAQP